MCLLRGTDWVFDIIQVKLNLQRLNTDNNTPSYNTNNAQAQERNFATLARKVIHRDWPHGERTSIESKTPPSCCYLLCQNTVYGSWGATAVIHRIQTIASSILLNAVFLKVSSFWNIRCRTHNTTSADFSIPAPPQCALTHIPIHTSGGY